jgi:hypothetical protein
MKVTIITSRAYDSGIGVLDSLRTHRCYAGFFMLKFEYEYYFIYCKYKLGC